MNRFSFANVALFLGSLIALTLSIVAIAIPYWEYVKLGGAERYYGLWKMCYNYRLVETCHQLEYVTSSMVLVRALEIIGVILLPVALLCRVVAHYGMRHRQRVFIWDGLLTFVSGLVLLAGTIVFGCDTQYELELFDDIDEYDLHASFAMCVVAGIIAIVSGILRLLLERKQRFSLQLHQNRSTQNQPPSAVPVVFGSSGAPRIVLVPMSQQPIINSQGITGNTSALALYPTIQMSKQPTLNSQSVTDKTADLAVYPSSNGANQNPTSRISLPRPCPGSPTSTSVPNTDGANYITANFHSSTPEPNPVSDISNIEESPSTTHSLPLCNQRMVSDSGSTEEIWKPLNLTNS